MTRTNREFALSWAFVWARRLEAHADRPQCRAVFRRSVRTSSDTLREALGSDLFGLIQMTADLEDVQECSLTRDRLRVILGRLIELNYSRFEIELRLTDSQWELLASGLRKVFSAQSQLLSIDGTSNLPTSSL